MLQMEIRNNTLTVEGYVNAVERYSKEIKENGKAFFEKIESGAFTRALKNNKNVQMLFNHNSQRVLAEQKDQTLTLTEDNIGLKVRAIISDSEVIEEAKKGNLTGWSFGFYCIKDNWKGNKRSIIDLNLFEVSILNVEPAYIGTSVELRNGEETVAKSIRSGELSLKQQEEPEKAQEETQEEQTEELPKEDEKRYLDEEKRQKQLQEIDIYIFLNK